MSDVAVTNERIHQQLTNLGLSTLFEGGDSPVLFRIEDVIFEVHCRDEILRIGALWDRRFPDMEAFKNAARVANEINASRIVPKLIVSQAAGGAQMRYSHPVREGLDDEQLQGILGLVINTIGAYQKEALAQLEPYLGAEEGQGEPA